MTHKTSEVLAFARGARERYETAVNDDARGVGRSPRQWRLVAVDLRLAGDALFGLLRDGAAGKPDSEAPFLMPGIVEGHWALAQDAEGRAQHAARMEAFTAQAGN